ncbi:MAG: ATP-binding protein [Verrucomicrobiota bacterium]|nr:ATP-binding protein [Verrucomicrobiota bacterium]
MKVQTKITLLLVLVVATFLGGLAAVRAYDWLKFRGIAEDRLRERNRSFEEFLKYHGDGLATLALDYSVWDQMVEAIGADDKPWFEDNVGTPTLDSFHANAIWIYRPDGSVAYQTNNLNAAELSQVPVPQNAFAPIFAQEPLAHFFVKLPQGVMEIRAATIHPSKDFKRQTPASGYLFAGRLWSTPALHEMSMFTGNEISLAAPAAHADENYSDEQAGLIAFSRTLRSWDGQPVAELVVRNESRIVRELQRSSERLLVSLILFALVLLLLLTTSLMRWVRRPLRQIMMSLERHDPAPIELLTKHSSEFGQLARTVQKFFLQQENLMREMEERRATEEALRKSEEELRHSQKMEAVGRLAGGVAHDFNNLLTAIIGYAELIVGRDGDPLVRQHAQLIRKAGDQAAALTKQLLAFSRKQLLQPRVIDLNGLVVDMEKLLRRVIGERFELLTQPAAEIGTVMADPSQIEQVLLNLGVNARDAMPSGGRLTIRTGNVRLDDWSARRISASLVAGDYVELSVTDTGVGMDAETKSHIFEPFFTTKGPGEGTGLGLATVYGIVRQTGGGISVQSEPGCGSTFSVYLPLERSPAEREKAAPEPLPRTQNFETVLVAEDEDIVRELVCDVLSEQGYNVICAADGHEAIQRAAEFDGDIHLLVTDVVMPQMNGPELAEKLLETRPGMRVLFVSGYSDNDISDHGVIDSRIDLLPKPFTPERLARKVREVIEERNAAESATTTA